MCAKKQIHPKLAKAAVFDPAAMEKRWNDLLEQDREAKRLGRLVGRYISHPYADGNAIYTITAESAKKVTIAVVIGIGDDWVLPAWGTKTTILKSVAQQFLQRRDALAALFEEGKKRRKDATPTS